MKKNVLLFFSLILLPGFLSAQIGISGAYQSMDAGNWESIIDSKVDPLSPENNFNNNYAVSIDYRFRLKSLRIEFLPELSFFQTKNHFRDSNNAPHHLDVNFFGFRLNTNIYSLNMEGDCDCPTFSKGGSLVQKGLFFQLSPGIDYLNKKHQYQENYPESSLTDAKNNNWAFSIGAGLGLDIGLSETFTLSPTLRARFYPKAKWDYLASELDANESVEKETSSLLHLSAGIKLGIRL
ncbi:MAG: hypothetical protein GY705_05860 [Bacteroidetes bacterium]|nr:hypothetical protein [Bacteroidota bacterium]